MGSTVTSAWCFEAYRGPPFDCYSDPDIAAFVAVVRRPLRQVPLGDVQGYKDSLAPLAIASQARKLSAVKSLLSFGHELGYLVFNVGAPVKLPAVKQTLAERILSEDAVLHMLAL